MADGTKQGGEVGVDTPCVLVTIGEEWTGGDDVARPGDIDVGVAWAISTCAAEERGPSDGVGDGVDAGTSLHTAGTSPAAGEGIPRPTGPRPSVSAVTGPAVEAAGEAGPGTRLASDAMSESAGGAGSSTGPATSPGCGLLQLASLSPVRGDGVQGDGIGRAHV